MVMISLGGQYTAQQIADMGPVNFLVPNEKSNEETDRLNARLADDPTYVYYQGKRQMCRSVEYEFESQLRLEVESFADCAKLSD